MDEELGLAYLGFREYGPALEAFERFAVSGMLCGSTLRNALLADEMGEYPRLQALLRKAGADERLELIRPAVFGPTD